VCLKVKGLNKLPSKTGLHRAAKRIEAVADRIVPFSRFSTPSGEGIKFHVIQVVRLLIKAYGREEAATHRSIEICSSADAAPITKSVGALTQAGSFCERPWCNKPVYQAASMLE
jgi:hypothetical protein